MSESAPTYRDMMNIHDQAEADTAFEALIDHCVEQAPDHTRAELETIQRSNLGYSAGYYDNETRERVERLFKCSHPIFGAIATTPPPSAEEAFKLGEKWAADSGGNTQ